jgi:Cu/Ag efflux protein CusF
MKKILALAMAVGFVASTTLAATQQASRQKTDEQSSPSAQAKSIRGTVLTVDNSAKSMTVRNDSGKELTVFWNDTTRVEGGELKEGATVALETSLQNGKMFASSIQITSAKKPL